MLKLSDNPPVLSPGIESLLDVPGPWWVAHTKARAEKKFAAEMLRRGVSYFLPMVERTAVWGGRKRKVLTPIFSSYVFFSGGETIRYEALLTDKLCQVIPVTDVRQLVTELDAIHRAIDSKHDFLFYPHAVIGKTCRITRGPLRGIIGTVIQNDDVTRIVLQVSMLGQGAALEIAADMLEAVDADPVNASAKSIRDQGGLK